MKRRILNMPLAVWLMGVALPFVAAAASDTNRPAFSRVRSWTNTVPAVPAIQLDIVNDTNTLCYSVEEILPRDVTPTNISDGGVWLPDRRAIRWGAFLNETNKTFTYQITGPSGEHALGGSSWFNGVWLSQPSATAIPIENDDDPGWPTPPVAAAMPEFDPPSGTTVPTNVTLSCATPEAEIRYTTDGSLPLAGSTLYVEPIEITEPALLRARAFAPDHAPSTAAWAYYPAAEDYAAPFVTREVSTNTPSQPVVSVVVSQVVDFACMAFEETLPPGLTPTNITAGGVWCAGSRAIHWGPALVGRDGIPSYEYAYALTGPPGTHTVSGRWSVDGRGGGGGSSAVPVSVVPGSDYEIPVKPFTAPAPTLDPPSSATLPVAVTITSSVAGSEIRYTTNGSDPTAGSTLYTVPVQIASPAILRARVFADGYAPSPAAWGRYEQQAAEPGLTLVRTASDSGTHLPGVRVDATPDAGLACVAVEERLPTGLTPYGIGQAGVWNPTTRTIRWAPVLVGRDAIPSYSYSVSGASGAYALDGGGSRDGYAVETTGDREVVVDLATMPRVETPVIAPEPDGRFPVTATVATATEGAEIRYTTDGSMPSEISTIYAGPLVFDTTVVLKARAFKPWMHPSAVASVYYGPPAIKPDRSSVTRRIFENGTDAPRIELECQAGEDVLNYAIEERLSAGVTPTEISGGGRFGAATRTIRWGPFFVGRDGIPSYPEQRTVSYRLSGTMGAHRLDGAGSFNGFGVPTVGEDVVHIHNGIRSGLTVSNDWTSHPTVTLSVTPDDSVNCYAVEFYLAASNVPSDISGDGLFNPDTMTIKWGPYLDHETRAFTFDLPGSQAQQPLSYRVSFNGVSHFFEQAAILSLGLPPPTNLAAVPGNGVAYLTWDATGFEAGVNVYYWTVPDRSDMVTIDAGTADGVYALMGLVNGETYSIAIRAYDTFGVESAESAVVTVTPDAAAGFYGIVFFDRDAYEGTTDETAEITVWDIDLNVDDGIAETVEVRVRSDSDPTGIQLTLRETSTNSGIFTASAAGVALGFSFEASDTGSAVILVREGDGIQVEYEDALPSGLRFDYAQFGEWDSDGDGLPDWWERRYFGGPRSADATALAANGVNTLLQAFLAGLDPTDPDAMLQLLPLGMESNGVVRIVWRSEPGIIYTIEKCLDLRNGFWPLIEGVPSTAPTNTYEDALDPHDPRPVFYRIVVP